MQKRHFTLLIALLSSLMVHVIFVGGGELALPDFYRAPDEVLARKPAGKVQRVQIVSQKPAQKAAAVQGAHLVKAVSASKKKKTEKKIAPETTPAPAEELAQAQSPEETPATPSTEKDNQVEAKPAPDPAPAFPVQLQAELELHLNGFSARAVQSWVMEGHRYAVVVKGSKFGFHAQLESEGEISSDGGLRPAHYAMKLNDRVRNFSEYRNGVVYYGKPGSPHDGPLPFPPQDVASLPFHVAVTFNGQPQTLFVSTGNRVYQVRLSAEAEETLKLPAGTLRTLHLRGERYDENAGKMITGYEVWLALDYLNFPVKFVGLTGNGDRFEYRARSLELEGKRVFGERDEDTMVSADEAVPEWLRQRMQGEDLNNR